jgi:hypothetical protein
VNDSPRALELNILGGAFALAFAKPAQPNLSYWTDNTAPVWYTETVHSSELEKTPNRREELPHTAQN